MSDTKHCKNCDVGSVEMCDKCCDMSTDDNPRPLWEKMGMSTQNETFGEIRDCTTCAYAHDDENCPSRKSTGPESCGVHNEYYHWEAEIERDTCGWEHPAGVNCPDCGHDSNQDHTKPTNPKDFLGVNSAPTSTISCPVMYEVGLAMLEGAIKYGRHNYREKGALASVYVDAAKGHIDQYYEGEDIDPDSGVHHLGKAIASLSVLLDCILRGNVNDDRPPKCEDGWKREANKRAKAMIERLTKDKQAEAPHTQVGSVKGDEKEGK